MQTNDEEDNHIIIKMENLLKDKPNASIIDIKMGTST
jgi:hypothetical protein